MKMLFLLLLSFSVLTCDAFPRPVFRHSLRFHKTSRLVKGVSWQKIVAGGAAAGTFVAAYKISDGVQDGIQTAAEKEPKTFLNVFSSFLSPLKWLICGVITLFIVWGSITFLPKIKLKRKVKNESLNQQK